MNERTFSGHLVSQISTTFARAFHIEVVPYDINHQIRFYFVMYV